jgi:outer membrane immunogenic protein
MKKLLLASAALAALSTAATAADLPRKSVAPVIAVPAFTWTGFYVGVNAGYAWGDFKRTSIADRGFWIPANIASIETIGTRTIKAAGFTGGVQIGYNYQINSVVFGLEADFNFADVKKSLSPEAVVLGALTAQTLSSTSRVEWLSTIRGRLGLAFDRFLVYGTGGLALASVKATDQYDFRPQGAPALGIAASSSSTRTGYAVGVGMEYAFTNNLTVKAEYLYVDLGRTTYAHGIVPGFPLSAATLTNKTTLNIARVGLNYKF